MKFARSAWTGLIMLALAFAVIDEAVATPHEQPTKEFEDRVSPLLRQYCYHCHGPDEQEAGLRTDVLNPDLIDGEDGEHWEEVLNQLNLGDMPPEDAKQPSARERATITDWVAAQMRHATEVRRSTGGRNVVRRLTTYEYNNTMRDLLGLDLDFARKLPPEGTAKEGFKNNSQVLVTSMLHVEYFQVIAKDALQRALVSGNQPEGFNVRAQPEDAVRFRRRDIGKSREHDGPWLLGPSRITSTGVILGELPEASDGSEPPSGTAQGKLSVLTTNFNGIPNSGPILIRIRAGAVTPEAGQYPRMQIMLGTDASTGQSNPLSDYVGSVDVEASVDEPKVYEFAVRAERFHLVPLKGRHQCLSILDTNEAGTVPVPPEKKAKLFIESVEVIAPYYPVWPPETRTSILFDSAKKDNEKVYAREVIKRFMRRAYRRPSIASEIDRMHDLFLTLRRRSESFDAAITDTLSAVLSAPGFLMLAVPEPEPTTAPQPRPLTDHELATRLSYFLWSTMPDKKLSDLADQGRLSDPRTLSAQVRRLLDDPRSDQFAEHFSSQWLGLDDIYSVAVNPEYFPNFRDEIKPLMIEETQRFFGTILRENLSCLTLIDSDFVMVDASMAKYYGIRGVAGSSFRKVALKPKSHRGGLLTQASVLTANSTGDDSHLVKRGVWVLERLLGDPPPPPPPAVPTLAQKDTKGERLSLREKLEAHRQETACMNCHRKIDPWGLAFENYDGIGKWRDTNIGTAPTTTPSTVSQPALEPSKAPTAAVVTGDSEQAEDLVGMLNERLEYLQKSFRKIESGGTVAGVERHLKFIEDRTANVEKVIDKLLKVRDISREEFQQPFDSRNKEILAANVTTLKMAERIVAGKRKPKKRAKKRQKKQVTQSEVDPHTTLHDGTEIQDLNDLKGYLLEHKKEQFSENITRKVLAYSLGRYLEFTDAQTVQTITDSFRKDGYRMRGLIETVVLSEAFRRK